MSSSVAAPIKTESMFDSSISFQSRLAGNAPLAETRPANPPSTDDELAHVRRRLFRTLERPELPMIVVDCLAVEMSQLQNLLERFLTDEAYRAGHNLVLAIPNTNEWAGHESFDIVQGFKVSAFEQGIDGQVSWLLINNRDEELAALQSLAS